MSAFAGIVREEEGEDLTQSPTRVLENPPQLGYAHKCDRDLKNKPNPAAVLRVV